MKYDQRRWRRRPPRRLAKLEHGQTPEKPFDTVGDAYDNAMAESFFATLECELIDRRSWQTKTEARLALFTYIEGWYNPRRRHSALGQVSPATFERNYKACPSNRLASNTT